MNKTTKLATIVSIACLGFWACDGGLGNDGVGASADALRGRGRGADGGTTTATEKRLKAKLLPPGVTDDADGGVTLHGSADYRERDGDRRFKASAESPDATTFIEGQSYPVTLTRGGAQIQLGSAEAECEVTATGVECEVSLEFRGADFPANFPATLDVGDTVDVGGIVSGAFN